MMKRLAGILLLTTLFTSVANAQTGKTKANISYPHLSVKIRLSKSTVTNVNELKLVMIISNNNSSPERFLFDKMNGTSTYPLATICNITNTHKQSVLQYSNMTAVEHAKYNQNNIQGYYYTLEPDEWLMKTYMIADMVRFDNRICKNGKLPKGTYYLQIIFNHNESNTITFEME